MFKAFLFLSFLAGVFSCHAQQATNQTALASFIQRRGDSLLKKENLPGMLVAVLNKGEKQFFTFGYAVPDQKIPFDAETVFEAGSITKTFTAYIVESVLAEKNISDTSSILSYLPDSVQTNKALGAVSFRSLLNHTSGLPRIPGNMALSDLDMAPYDHYAEKDLFAFLKTATPKPDGNSNYSNLGMGLAGVLAQKITGKNFTTLLQQYIFQPFGMKDQTNTSKKSQGYYGTTKAVYWQMAALAPAGGLKTTASQLLTYLQQMSKPTAASAKQVIPLLLEPTARVSPVMRIGKGWHTIEQKDKPVIYWHNGGTFGFSTFAAFVKDTEQAVVVVVNRANASQVSDGFGIAIMKKLLDEK